MKDLLAEVAALRTALAPFVASYNRAADHIGDSDLYGEQPRAVHVTLGDCRKAARIAAMGCETVRNMGAAMDSNSGSGGGSGAVWPPYTVMVPALISETDYLNEILSVLRLIDQKLSQPKAPNCPVCGVAPGGKHV
jgi:hypothetical protein